MSHFSENWGPENRVAPNLRLIFPMENDLHLVGQHLPRCPTKTPRFVTSDHYMYDSDSGRVVSYTDMAEAGLVCTF